MSKPQEYLNVSGDPFHDRRRQQPAPPRAAAFDRNYTQAVAAHVEKTIGPCGQVFRETDPSYVHVDIFLINPDRRRPWQTLVTCGMGARPMPAPPGREIDARLELALCLPPEWPLFASAGGVLQAGPGIWIVHGLRATAKLPFMFNAFFAEGQAIPNGDPPEPIAGGTDLCCSLLIHPRRISNPSFQRLKLADGLYVRFLSVIMLNREEMDYKLRRGYEALMNKLDDNDLDEMLILGRPGVCRGGLLGFLGF